MGCAMKILKEVGFDAIEEHEKVLNQKLVDGLKARGDVIIYGDSDDLSDRVGVVSFKVKDVSTYHLAMKMADTAGVATRRGAFCANPYVWRLLGVSDDAAKELIECGDAGTPGMIRVSFGIYNTEEEVDEFLKIMDECVEVCKGEITAYNPET